MEFGNRLYVQYGAICRVLGTPTVVLDPQSSPPSDGTYSHHPHSWGMGLRFSEKCLSFFGAMSIVRICLLSRAHGAILCSVLNAFKEVH